ncbi:fibronectin type III domain-containing protein [Cryptosporangium phraense]|uniref:Fibronectin type-III domain-containing protein n=1 Tax=Cryptosporangium phraense TaxID=2593070 RepID=A0A545AL29_9ACTN|nr:fibronectin type III domain-containing protein [Cryptosporangium phraense]TQS41970.1 hypothetical protein FL583_27205 [Cryptosporangium phraense]
MVGRTDRSAIVLDRGARTVSRIDGAHLSVARAKELSWSPDTILSRTTSAYLVDVSAGQVSYIDPNSLDELKVPIRLGVAVGTPILTGDGSLWIPVPSTGEIIPIRKGLRESAVRVSPDTAVTEIDGTVYAVDVLRRELVPVRGGKRIGVALTGLPPDPEFMVPDGPSVRFVAVEQRSAVLHVANADGEGYRAVSLPVPGGGGGEVHYGKPLTVGDYVYVPDNSTGSLLSYNVRTRQLLSLPITGRPTELEAFRQDDRIWVNDPAGPAAAVVTGQSVHRVTKYQTVAKPSPSPSPSPTANSPTSATPDDVLAAPAGNDAGGAMTTSGRPSPPTDRALASPSLGTGSSAESRPAAGPAELPPVPGTQPTGGAPLDGPAAEEPAPSSPGTVPAPEEPGPDRTPGPDPAPDGSPATEAPSPGPGTPSGTPEPTTPGPSDSSATPGPEPSPTTAEPSPSSTSAEPDPTSEQPQPEPSSESPSPEPPPVSPPGAVSVSVSSGPGYIDVSWSPPSDGGPTVFYIVAWLDTTDGSSGGVPVFDPGATSYRITGLKAGDQVLVGVAAGNESGQGPNSFVEATVQ